MDSMGNTKTIPSFQVTPLKEQTKLLSSSGRMNLLLKIWIRIISASSGKA